ncbi:MAG: hypothetical protein PHR51_01110 [Patescibacteria group bacterium]|nr:hypothetical protein [Patescibacteria group bacterium]
MDKTTKALITSVGVRAITAIADIVLGGILAWESWVLYQRYLRVTQALNGSILSGNETEFIAKLKSQLPEIYLWIIALGGLAITLMLCVSIFLTRDRLNQIMVRVNLAWLLLWVGLGVCWFVAMVAALISFKTLLGQ